MTAIEVYLTYQNMQPVKMLTILLALSFLKPRSSWLLHAPEVRSVEYEVAHQCVPSWRA